MAPDAADGVQALGGSALTGVALVMVAVLLIAVGANVQRLALMFVAHPRRICRCLSARSSLWFVGLCIYFFANVLYTFGLVYAPASLCATLMAAIIPINALTSRLILGETLELVDVQGGICITVGITLAAYAAPYTSDSYTASQLRILFLEPDCLEVLSGLCAVLCLLMVVVLCYERLRATPRATDPSRAKPAYPPSALAACMPFCYPVVVGLLESLVQVAQKGGSSMVALTAAGDSQMGATFWAFLAAWALLSLVVVW